LGADPLDDAGLGRTTQRLPDQIRIEGDERHIAQLDLATDRGQQRAQLDPALPLHR